MCRKEMCLYPYDCINSFNRFSEKKLQNKDDFYSISNSEHISDTQYVHAIKVWKTFKLKNMGEFIFKVRRSFINYLMYSKTLERLVCNIIN